MSSYNIEPLVKIIVSKNLQNIIVEWSSEMQNNYQKEKIKITTEKENQKVSIQANLCRLTWIDIFCRLIYPLFYRQWLKQIKFVSTNLYSFYLLMPLIEIL